MVCLRDCRGFGSKQALEKSLLLVLTTFRSMRGPFQTRLRREPSVKWFMDFFISTYFQKENFSLSFYILENLHKLFRVVGITQFLSFCCCFCRKFQLIKLDVLREGLWVHDWTNENFIEFINQKLFVSRILVISVCEI